MSDRAARDDASLECGGDEVRIALILSDIYYAKILKRRYKNQVSCNATL